MPQSYAALFFHLIFSTKDRQPLLGPDWRPRLHEYLGGILRNRAACLLAAGGMPDHAHLLVSLSREALMADTLRDIKAISSKWVHEEIGQAEFAWQAGYGAFTVSYSAVEAVRHYIVTQEEHHRRMSFQEEFIAFLRRHDIAYDERYLWA